MHIHSLPASIIRIRRYSVVLLLALLGLFQVAGASARPARPGTAGIRPGTTIPGTDFTWVTATTSGTAGNSVDQAEDVAFLPDGRLATTGCLHRADGERVFAVAVYRRDGTLDWQRTVAGSAVDVEDSGLHVAVDPTGNVVAVGYVSDALTRTGVPFGNRKKKQVGPAGGPVTIPRQSIFAISYTSTGTERWRRQIDSPDDLNSYPNDIAIDSVGNVLIAGVMDGFETSLDFLVAKLLGSDGFVSWQKRFDSEGGIDAGLGVAWTPSANAGEQDDVVATGYLSPNRENRETIVYKIDGDLGAFNHWAESIEESNEPLSGAGEEIVVDAAGDVIVAGNTGSGFSGEFLVAKLLGTNGTTEWTHRKSGEADFADAAASTLAIGPNGELAAGGYINTDSGGSEAYLARLDPQTGSGIWSRTIEAQTSDRVVDLAFDPLAGIVTAVLFFDGKIGSQQFDVYRHDVDGNEIWHRFTSGDGPGSDQANAVAVDSFGNVGAAGFLTNATTQFDYTVAYVDCQAPMLSNPSVVPNALPSNGGNALAKVTATDNIGIDTIEVVVTNPDTSESRFAMTPGTGAEYEKVLTFPANATGSPKLYKLVFTAKDATGNVTSLLGGNVVVNPADVIPPTVANCQMDPDSLPSGGGTVAVSAEVNDNVGVGTVEAVVTRPDSSFFTVPMALITGNQYSGTIPIPANPDPVQKVYSVKVVARDISNNGTSEDCGDITVAAADTQHPNVVSCLLDPTNLPFTGGTVTVSAVVTDNVGVTAVTAIVNPPSGPTTNVTLVRGSGDNWSGTFSVPGNTATGTANYGVQIKADDASGNSTTEICGTVAVAARDTTPPSITNPQISPTSLPVSGGTVTIRATVTDAGGVASVKANVFLGPVSGPTRTRPRGGITPVPVEPVAVVIMTSIGKDLYEGTFNAPANEGPTLLTYNVVIEARDTSNNPASVAAGSFTVATSAPGRLQVSHTLLNFGLVNLGNTSRRTFRIKNVGKGLLTGEMTLPDVPFMAFIKEGKDLTSPSGDKRGLLFTLDPNEVITVQVEFSPTVHARYGSEILVFTNDPKRKKPARVVLKGLGCRIR